ncbi:pirin family protein [Pseudomonas citronellolis]|uniref:pirin family protein n=1 Tax=Pseudomonas citronellolis TaxID=53408 RepID=UPI0023E47785|nr:pirin family protein [Pseudomonas citronellolis]MDF3934235.1 pirin family protein [Pseudomonas citronellolis]
MTQLRNLIDLNIGRPASDGAGVRLTRVIGGPGLERFDPFLMLDQFDTQNPDDYIGGFPDHPHRGFETVTYMLEGRMRHRDHLGNEGLLKPGGVQWMTAAHGIIHSEMPEQVEGAMRGFQLWLNLPAKSKLGAAGYRDIEPADVPRLTTADGVEVTVIAGRFDDGRSVVEGAVQRPDTEPQYYDLKLPAGAALHLALPRSHRVLLYVYEGALQVEAERGGEVGTNRLARLGEGDAVRLASANGARVLVLAGKPLNEPIVQYGPFVMNSRDEIEQALRDYRDGVLAV